MDENELFAIRLANGDVFYSNAMGADEILGHPAGQKPVTNHFVSIQTFQTPAARQRATAYGFVWINPTQVASVLRLSTVKS